MGGTRISNGEGEADSIQQNVVLTKEGEVSYDTKFSVMEIKGKDTLLQVGQESHIPVTNLSGGTLNEGDVVRQSGYDAATDRITVVKSQADITVNADVLGMCTTTMLNGETGKITTFGRINELDTSMFTEGDEVFLSPTVLGGITATRPETLPIEIGYIGKSDALAGWIHLDIVLEDVGIHATLSDTTDQTFVADVSKAVVFNTNDVLQGITHSETVDPSEITFPSEGSYYITIEPQYVRTVGGGSDILNMYIQKKPVSGSFTNIPDSNIKLGISSADVDAVSPLTQTIDILKDEKIRIMINATSTNIALDAFPASGTAPDDIPATPSVIINITRLS